MPFDPTDEILRAVSDRRRRQVLAAVAESDTGTIQLDTLVEHLLSGEDESADRNGVALALHHDTLPVLSDAGLIDYDGQNHLVRSREDSTVETVLALLSELEALEDCEC